LTRLVTLSNEHLKVSIGHVVGENGNIYISCSYYISLRTKLVYINDLIPIIIRVRETKIIYVELTRKIVSI